MYSVSSIANNMYLMYSFAQKNGVSLTSNYGSVSSLSGSSSSNTTTALNNFWKNYSSGTSSSGSSSSSSTAGTISSDLTTLSTVKSGMSDLLASYATTSKTFKAELGSTLSDLKSSAAKVAKMDFNVGSASAATSSTTSGTSTSAASTTNTKLTDALKNIKSLVDNYNTAVSFFSDNSSVSARVKSFATSFSDTTYNANTYAKIGINVDSSTGKLSIDETKLTKALQETPDRVENLLGSNGLAGKAEDKVQRAEAQSSKLFPSVSSMLGSELKTASLYNSKTLTAMSSYTNVGTLLDMYF